jgi:hypothetical protein
MKRNDGGREDERSSKREEEIENMNYEEVVNKIGIVERR